jgi:hypothetical protein
MEEREPKIFGMYFEKKGRQAGIDVHILFVRQGLCMHGLERPRHTTPMYSSMALVIQTGYEAQT